jgi:hypothetical protein
VGENALAVDGFGLIGPCETPGVIEAESPRLAAGPKPASGALPHILMYGGASGLMLGSAGPVDSRCWHKWLQSARLETRTKESNTYASSKVANLGCAMKVNVGGIRKVHHRPTRIFCERFE